MSIMILTVLYFMFIMGYICILSYIVYPLFTQIITNRKLILCQRSMYMSNPNFKYKNRNISVILTRKYRENSEEVAPAF